MNARVLSKLIEELVQHSHAKHIAVSVQEDIRAVMLASLTNQVPAPCHRGLVSEANRAWLQALIHDTNEGFRSTFCS